MPGLDLAGKKILVTGGSGFLGRHLLPRLVAGGTLVTCLARSDKAASKLPSGVKPAPGDCGDASAVAAAVKGQDAVIHMAGLLFGASWRDYLEANVAYARNIGAAAVKSDARRVIFVSSLAAAGPCAALPGRDEQSAPVPVSAYGWSKLAAENVLRNALGDRLVIVRPPVIYGSGDRAMLPLFKSCKAGVGIAPAGDFPLSLIHADDAAAAIMLCLTPAASGAYHLSDGQAHTMTEFCDVAGSHFGRQKLAMLRSPAWLLAASAAAGSGINVLMRAMRSKRRCLAWSWDKYREGSQAGWLADDRRIRTELGFEPQKTLETGIAEAAAGYERDGWL